MVLFCADPFSGRESTTRFFFSRLHSSGEIDGTACTLAPFNHFTKGVNRVGLLKNRLWAPKAQQHLDVKDVIVLSLIFFFVIVSFLQAKILYLQFRRRRRQNIPEATYTVANNWC